MMTKTAMTKAAKKAKDSKDTKDSNSRPCDPWSLWSPSLARMSSTELAIALFRTTQTEGKLRREGVCTKEAANRVHKEVGQKVRQTIRELGGTMPENLPAAENIKKVESREKKRLKAEAKKALSSPTEDKGE